MSCNMVTSSSCYLFHLLNWWLIATMTQVNEKDCVPSCLIATPPSEMCLSVAPWSSQEGLASPWRYLQHVANLTQKLETAPEPLPQGRIIWKESSPLRRVCPWAWSDLSSAIPFSCPVLQGALQSSVPPGHLPTKPSHNLQLHASGGERHDRCRTAIHLYLHVCQLFRG